MNAAGTISRWRARAAGALALAVWLGLSGCAGSSKTTGANGGQTGTGDGSAAAMAQAESLLAKLRASYATTPELSLNGDMKSSSAGVVIWYDALVRGYDSLKITLVGPFGVPVGALSAAPTQFLFFNAIEGTAVEGTPDRQTFGKLMQLDLEYPEMVSMLRGELPRFPQPGTYTAEERDGVMYYTVRTDRNLERFAIDIDNLAVASYSRLAPSGDQESEEIGITYKDFYTLDGRQFPKKVTVNIANGQQKVAVTVDKMRSSIAKGQSFTLDLPAGIERRRL